MVVLVEHGRPFNEARGKGIIEIQAHRVPVSLTVTSWGAPPCFLEASYAFFPPFLNKIYFWLCVKHDLEVKTVKRSTR